MNHAAIFLKQRVLRRHHHKAHAEQGVRAGGIHSERILHTLTLHGEIDICALGAADPVDLLLLDILRIVHRIQPLQKLIGILRDAQIPNVLGSLHDLAVANIAFAPLRILIGKHHAAAGAVIHEGGIAEHKPAPEHLKKDPLRPFVVVFVRGIDHSVPIKRKADAAELLREFCNIAVGHGPWMNALLDRRVFRWQPEGVKPDGKQDIIALHSALATDDLKAGICLDMTHMHPASGGIRKFHQTVKFRFIAVVFGGKRPRVCPALLPFRFNFCIFVSHGFSPLLISR